MSTVDGGTVLEARKVRYYSYNDEAAFFGWLDKISCVTSYAGRGDTLYIEIDAAAVGDDDFIDLFALFRRYGVDREQLRPLDQGHFASWF
ncbi:hypothetical protein [Nocardia alni]|uniref:hypothetical protein n=1 Tax=Nocardia alni TaxID=2815723 RepID=UPI001C24244A|nr:hypothetical protein [Nocardia alni]